MNIWIITTGNSDVQLKHDFLTKDKARWNNLYRTGKQALKRDHAFQPVKKDDDVNLTVPARVMGVICGNQLNDDIYGDLYFPLLDAFSKKLEGQNQPDRIIVILTNQEAAYTNPDKKSPYWKDTCTLKPILDKYFQKNFPKIKEKIEYLELNPKSKDEGLDNWDQALKLVQQELSTLEFKPLDNIYVSHQAGTPAISSAIQFVSLAKFGKKVTFLVSNEYEPENTRLITSSNYLRGIQLQEARVLLERFDYSGVESLLKAYWLDSASPQEKKLRELLKIAIQWNFANFDEFAKGLGEAAQERLKTWWWTGYEAAYLAVVRLEQGNTVEALFHSFRAVEGLICKWAEHTYPAHIHHKIDGSPQIKSSILGELSNYLNKKHSLQDELKRKGYIGLYSDALYQLVQTVKPESKEKEHIMGVFWDEAKKLRNPLFHRLLGLHKKDIFKAWYKPKDEDIDKERKSKKITNYEEAKENLKDSKANVDTWKNNVLGCLNFIAEQEFTSLQKASLMHQLHQDLKQALIDYELQAFTDLNV
ncbi:hypothetical protein [Fischerella thermalis]|uniref:hypothetical protein n=1 Tax=Fischerella thermalis TaxID=372787 RepID=UPI000C808FB4|nr:hypothetical protein [Fischerella thermalis]MBF1990824.1 hypothetical protein [Fischerella thermalis M58_A2018_009]MBF2061282.1 hypothetical protein [Fischerella thermalis M66_A2018_004]PLZ91813.1 hypothetical protein CI593_06060 [Fischerella thermalis CCMEE 5194]